MYRTHDVGILVNELEEAFQAPEKTLQTTHDGLGDRILILFQLAIDVLQDDSNYPAYGDDERAEGQRTQVVPAESRFVKFKLARAMRSGELLNKNHLAVRSEAVVIVKNGMSDLLNVQYHVANVAAKIISLKAVRKNSPQSNPTILYAAKNTHTHTQ